MFHYEHDLYDCLSIALSERMSSKKNENLLCFLLIGFLYFNPAEFQHKDAAIC